MAIIVSEMSAPGTTRTNLLSERSVVSEERTLLMFPDILFGVG